MLRLLLASLAVTAPLAPAYADAPADNPPRDQVAPGDAGAYVGFGVLSGVNHYSYSGAMFQAGSGLGSLPVFARFALGGGLATQWHGEAGWFMQTRVGLELRHCFANTRTCAFGGLDAGITNARYDSADGMTSEEVLGLLGVARAGIELPAGPVRFRLAAEATRVTAIFSPGSGDGLAVDLAAFHAF